MIHTWYENEDWACGLLQLFNISGCPSELPYPFVPTHEIWDRDVLSKNISHEWNPSQPWKFKSTTDYPTLHRAVIRIKAGWSHGLYSKDKFKSRSHRMHADCRYIMWYNVSSLSTYLWSDLKNPAWISTSASSPSTFSTWILLHSSFCSSGNRTLWFALAWLLLWSDIS